jgi:hypothetical protein
MATSWGFSLQLWIIFDGDERTISFALVDLCLAAAFFQMSLRHWFPVPLFFAHVLLVAYHVYAFAVGSSAFWVNLFLNRIFEMALIYILACGIYRIFALHSRDAIRD